MDRYETVVVSQPSGLARRWRIAACVVAGLVGALVGLGAAFTAAVELSGCFITCGEPDYSEGFGAALLAGASFAAGPLVAAALFGSQRWLRAGVAIAVSITALLAVLAPTAG